MPASGRTWAIQVLTLSAQVIDQTERKFVVGLSKVTQNVIDIVQEIAKLSSTVLILGESETGKELLARLIHRESSEPGVSFIAVNLAATRTRISERAMNSPSSATPLIRWPIALSSSRKNVNHQEHQTISGRIATGLVHDLATDSEHRQHRTLSPATMSTSSRARGSDTPSTA